MSHHHPRTDLLPEAKWPGGLVRTAKPKYNWERHQIEDKVMKLEAAKLATLVEVLNAQSGVKPIEDKEAYKAKLAEVSDLLASKDGKFTGGVTKEVYADNKDSAELVEASRAHLNKGKERAAKAAEKAAAPKKEAKAKAPKAPKASKEATPEQEAARGKAIVDFVNAVTGVKKLSKEEYNAAYNRAKKYLDFEKGGILNTAPEGKKTPWERFKGFEGVEEAGKAHRAYVKAKAKTAPEPTI
jgi:hypothetical protein